MKIGLGYIDREEEPAWGAREILAFLNWGAT